MLQGLFQPSLGRQDLRGPHLRLGPLGIQLTGLGQPAQALGRVFLGHRAGSQQQRDLRGFRDLLLQGQPLLTRALQVPFLQLLPGRGQALLQLAVVVVVVVVVR